MNGTISPRSAQRRSSGLWLILASGRDEEDRVLTVNPNYGGKTGRYQLVGGSALPDESPDLAAIRHGQAEIGVKMVPDTMLIADYVKANPDKDSVEGLNLVFLHRLAAGTPIVLNAGAERGTKPPLLGYKLLTVAELESHCAPYQERRIREALAAVADPALRGFRIEGNRVPVAA